MVLSVNERTFTKEVLESHVPDLVNFEAPWCGLCHIIKPLLLQFHWKCGAVAVSKDCLMDNQFDN